MQVESNMNATNGTGKAFGRRKAFLALLLAFFIPGCHSTTEPIPEPLPIVFFEGVTTGQLVLMSADGKVRQQLLDMPAAFANYPRWSPNGQQIVFHHIPTDPQGTEIGLFIINADGSGLRKIPSPPTGLQGADWAPDGSRLVAYSGDRLVVFGSDGSDFAFLPPTNISIHGYRGISWSPDGNEILYNGTHEYDGTPGPDIWIFNLVTGMSRMLIAPAFDGRWSPDGRRVAYVSIVPPTLGVDERRGLAVIDSDGSNQRILITDSPTVPRFAWSPDGTRLLFVGGGADYTGLYSIPVGGGQPTAITSNTPGIFAWHPDWHWER
jgi:Tol biopolymer transport system component